jgi:hypothetical protein
MNKRQKPSGPDSSAVERFEELTRRLLAVPRKELQDKLDKPEKG